MVGILSLSVIPCVQEESDSIRLRVYLAPLILQTKSMILNQITENVYFGSAFIKIAI